jgi:nucleotide-binding universal stress UspA family protein
LVVMATHGRRGLTRLVLGSVAERVVRESITPVLTVRPIPAGRCC